MKHRRVASALVASLASGPVDVYAKPPKPAHHAQTHQDARNARARGYGTRQPVGPRRPSQALPGPSQGLSKAHAARKACQPYAGHIRAAEQAKGLPAKTLEALVYAESRCNPRAEHKRTGARGLGQHTASGAAAVRRILRARGEAPWFRHVDAFDPAKSIHAAAELLAWGLETCGSLVEAIGAYNSGTCTESRFARAVLRLAAFIRFVTETEEPRS